MLYDREMKILQQTSTMSDVLRDYVVYILHATDSVCIAERNVALWTIYKNMLLQICSICYTQYTVCMLFVF